MIRSRETRQLRQKPADGAQEESLRKSAVAAAKSGDG